jgi:hypothetical protein
MSRHHYDDFAYYGGNRWRDPIVPVRGLIGWSLPFRGVARHRVVEGFTTAMSKTIKANQARKVKMAQGAAEMCVKVVEAVRRGGMFHFEATIG